MFLRYNFARRGDELYMYIATPGAKKCMEVATNTPSGMIFHDIPEGFVFTSLPKVKLVERKMR